MSILEIPGAKDVAVEIFSMSKSYNMAGWRVGFCLGNKKMINALARIKSYLDYGVFSRSRSPRSSRCVSARMT
ncbi:MAG: aminotransferase class I/II-fold pyridoxal phosphate-dependent enzyme [Bryobacterales bacterium]